MSVNNIDQDSLLQKVKLFDQDALSEIYDIYSPALYRYSVRLLGNPLLAEDCVSDTFYRFLRIIKNGIGPNDHLQSYLYRIAHNWITDYYRQNRVEYVEIDEEVPNNEISVEEFAQQKIQKEQIRQALLSLTAEQQQVIILKYLEGWENGEIARVLNKKNGAVRILAHRAINALQKKVKKLEKENAERSKK